MAEHQKITPVSGVEAEVFTVGFDHQDHPISKPVAAMTREEKLQAMAIMVGEFEAAFAEVEPIQPLVEANFMPDTLEAGLLLVAKCFAFEELRARMERLAQAVAAMEVH
jgi:hypothetical protein